MLIQPIDYFLVGWFTIAALCTAYVAVDQYRNNPEPVVMKWGFILVTLYTGPIGLLLYVLADKEPRPGEHEAFVKPLWKQGVGSTIHCIAGDATGIILAAVITAALGLPMWLDLLVEYAFGFAFGLFIFQALFMKSMMGGTYWQNVRRSFIPELISMNFMMAGMAPVMSFLMMGRDMRAMVPTELIFWGVMSLGVIAGIWAEKFDQLAAFQNFLIMPLTFLSGVFYSVHSLPPFWQQASRFNPFFYMIDGFRHGFFGVSDASPWLSLAVVGACFAILTVFTLNLLKSGYKLRA